jgi:hypothetical protein
VQGTIYLSQFTRGSFSSPNVTESRSQVNTEGSGASDGVFLYLNGTRMSGDRCFCGTFSKNRGRTGGHSHTRTNVTYECCNFVNNSHRNNVLYQYSGGTATLRRCIFVENRNKDGRFAGLGHGLYTITNCVFDGLDRSSATISFSTGMVTGQTAETNTLWHLNTAACPGLRSPTAVFAHSASIFASTGTFSVSAVSAESAELPCSSAFSRSLSRSPVSPASAGLNASWDGANPASAAFGRCRSGRR